MPVEIERKFLVAGSEWKSAPSTIFRQGYLSREKGRTVRVRVAGEQAFLTIKGMTQGISRAEFEYEIPRADAEELLRLCDGPLIEKTRYLVLEAGTTWEVDEFHGENAGLVIAEVELDAEDEPFARPKWLGREVTGDHRYANSQLSACPYREWRDEV